MTAEPRALLCAVDTPSVWQCPAAMFLELIAVDMGDLPRAVAVAVEPAYAAGVQMKFAVFVQVGSSDPADNADDRKVVTDDDDGV